MRQIEFEAAARGQCQFRLAVPTLGKLDALRAGSQIAGTDRAQRGVGVGKQPPISIELELSRTGLLGLRQESGAGSEIAVVVESSNPPNVDFVCAKGKISGGQRPNCCFSCLRIFLVPSSTH